MYTTILIDGQKAIVRTTSLTKATKALPTQEQLRTCLIMYLSGIDIDTAIEEAKQLERMPVAFVLPRF